MEETQALGRRALTEWSVAARASGEARRRAERKDALFVKVGAWLEELRANKALSPSPEANRRSPAGRAARRAQFKAGLSGLSPSPSAPSPSGAAPLATRAFSPSGSDVTPPRAHPPPAPTLRDSGVVSAWLAADDVATPPGAKADDWLDLDDTPPNVEKMLEREERHGDARRDVHGGNGKENRTRATKTTTKTPTAGGVGTRGGLASRAMREVNIFNDVAAEDSPELASVTKSRASAGSSRHGGNLRGDAREARTTLGETARTRGVVKNTRRRGVNGRRRRRREETYQR